MLYPETIQLNHEEFTIINQIQKELENLGFNIKSKKNNKIEINGIPNDNREYNINFIIDELIQNFKDTGIKNINAFLSVEQNNHRFSTMEKKV